MINLTTALGRNGLQDWLLQRVTAIILALYSLLLLGFWFYVGNDIFAWINFFNNYFICYATFAALLALMVHAWIGIWIVATDYIKNSWLRLILFLTVYLILLFYAIWAIQILWG
mgnify:CR=1 FL=1